MTWAQLVTETLRRSPYLAFPQEDLKKIESRRRSKRRVYVRFAYQWKDEKGKGRRELSKALKETVRGAFDEIAKKATGSSHALDYASLRSEAGTYLLRKIMVDILSADILFFDLTYRNPNVMFELGIAYAMGRRFFLMVRKDRINDVPSDLSGLTISPYRDTAQFSSSSTLSDIRRTLREVIKRKMR